MWFHQKRLQKPWQTWEEFLIQRVLLLTGGDCFFSRKTQTFKLFSFLICLPLCTNQTCKYCIFESYLWIVLYRLRLATTKKVENPDKKQEKDNGNGGKKRAMLYCICIHFSSCLWMNVSLCYKAIHNTVSTHTKKKDMPSGLVEVADFRSSRTQKHVLYLVLYHCLFKFSSSVWVIKTRECCGCFYLYFVVKQ